MVDVRQTQANPAGWDGGMVYPGQSYRRTFYVPGTYIYTDGQGHTATITVLPDIQNIYLPMIIR